MLNSRKCASALVTVLIVQSASSGADAAVVPIPSINVINNSCTTWRITQTYTATEVPDSIVNALAQWSAYSYEDHFHAQGYSGQRGRWTAFHSMSGTPTQKLEVINNAVFGTKSPRLGMVKTLINTHQGTCAAEEGLRECVGIFVNTALLIKSKVGYSLPNPPGGLS